MVLYEAIWSIHGGIIVKATTLPVEHYDEISLENRTRLIYRGSRVSNNIDINTLLSTFNWYVNWIIPPTQADLFFSEFPPEFRRKVDDSNGMWVKPWGFVKVPSYAHNR